MRATAGTAFLFVCEWKAELHKSRKTLLLSANLVFIASAMMLPLKRGTQAIHAVTSQRNKRVLGRHIAPTNSIRSATARAVQLVPRPTNTSDSDEPTLSRDHASKPFSESVMELILGVILLVAGGVLRGIVFLRPLPPKAGPRCETRNCPTLTRTSRQQDPLRRDSPTGSPPYPTLSLMVGQHNSAPRDDGSRAK